MDRGAWYVTVHEVAKSQTWLSDFIFLSFSMYTKVLKILDNSKWNKNGNESSGENKKRCNDRYWFYHPRSLVLRSILKQSVWANLPLCKVFISIKKEEMCIFFAFFLWTVFTFIVTNIYWALKCQSLCSGLIMLTHELCFQSTRETDM